MNIKRLVKPCVRALKAYEAKEIPCKVKLDANESPYGFKLSTKLIATNRYPDPEAKGVKRLLARQMRVAMSNILTGNGSDELIYYLINTFGGPVLYPTPTFVMYGIIAQSLGEKSISVPLNKDFDIDYKEFIKTIKREKPKLVFLSTPNNPTGNCFSAEMILKTIEATRGIVVVDEAYQAFSSDKGFVPMLRDYDNLVIMRTLSKVGLAALRLGYMVAHEDVINEVNKVRLPFNLNVLSQVHAEEALQDKKGMRLYINTIVRERKKLMNELQSMKGIATYPSEANFIMFRVTGKGLKKNGKPLTPETLHARLLKKGILIKNLGAVVEGCMRVTVGSEKENKVFITAMKEILT